MPTDQPQLPPKPEVAMALLQTASSVFVHLDPRGGDVVVPSWFKKQPQLVLQIGLNMAVPIVDLDVGEEAISCTLSFNRSPEFCKIPWDAIYGLVGEDGRGMIWPDSVPAEVAAAADGRSPVAPAEKARKAKLQIARPSKQGARFSGQTTPDSTLEANPMGTDEIRAEASKKDKAATPAVRPRADGGEEPGKKTGEGAASNRGGAKRELPPYLRVVK
jgi:hypothetical protein